MIDFRTSSAFGPGGYTCRNVVCPSRDSYIRLPVEKYELVNARGFAFVTRAIAARTAGLFVTSTRDEYPLLRTLGDEVAPQFAARFGLVSQRDRPKRGQMYSGNNRSNSNPQSGPKPQVQRNTAIKDKGPNPRHSEQQNAGGNSSTRLSVDRLS